MVGVVGSAPFGLVTRPLAGETKVEAFFATPDGTLPVTVVAPLALVFFYCCAWSFGGYGVPNAGQRLAGSVLASAGRTGLSRLEATNEKKWQCQ